jgi:hypothetical protein
MAGREGPVRAHRSVEAFKKKMTDAGAKYEVVGDSGGHARLHEPGRRQVRHAALAYSADADKTSWADLCWRC